MFKVGNKQGTWTGRTKGNLVGYFIFVWLIKHTNLNITYFVLRFVSQYYTIFSASSRRYLIRFYRDRMGFSTHKARKLISSNFFLLAQSIVDRTAFLMNRDDKFSFHKNNRPRLLDRSKKGMIMVSGHFGNWSIAGSVLRSHDVRVNVVMYENEHKKIQELIYRQVVKPNVNVISITDDFSHIIAIHQALKNGEVICMLADRFLEGSDTFQFDFFGKPARFAAGPFLLIEKFNVNYSFFFVTKTSKFHYELDATTPQKPAGTAQEIAKEFVTLLEENVKIHPDQWFNYHDFYKLNGASN